jgi:hypothetical protein
MRIKIMPRCSEKRTLILVILFVICAHISRSYAINLKIEKVIYLKMAPIFLNYKPAMPLIG